MTQQNKIDLEKYQEFVLAITSETSTSAKKFADRILELSNTGFNPALLNTVAIGLPAEAGEFSDIVKKVLFHGKEATDDVKAHLLKELGDVMWYWINACTALNADPYAIIQENMNKLLARYPGGVFDATLSNNRKEGDI